MPLYAYRCDRCGITSERVRAVADRDALLRCDTVFPSGKACQGRLERRPTAASFSVKGHNAKNHYGLKGD